MLRASLLALMACGLLSGCLHHIGYPPIQPGMDLRYSQSVGFTGLGGDFHN